MEMEAFSVCRRAWFNFYKLYPVGLRELFRQQLICHYGLKHKGVKKLILGVIATEAIMSVAR